MRKIQHLSNELVEQVHDKSRLEKANAVIDIMSTALSLVAEINETGHLNISKVILLKNIDLFVIFV